MIFHYVIMSMVFISGVAGLTYQIAWQKYLGVLLGSHAKATAITLSLFLSGLSLGYYLFGRWSRKTQRHLGKSYAVIEMVLAIWALIFPFLFQWLSRIEGNGIIYDIGVSALLLLLPTVLMGGTLPLLTQALSASVEKATRTHAHVYGINTLGACVGALISGYFLMPHFGLKGTLSIAAILNLFVFSVSYFMAWPTYKREIGTLPLEKKKLGFHGIGILVLCFFSGYVTLCLESILMRIFALSAGGSQFNYNLVVAIFIFGIGIGSLLLPYYKKKVTYPLYSCLLGGGIALMFLYLACDQLPYWVHLIRIPLRDTLQGYYLYQISLGMVLLVILSPAAILLGMILPLCFDLLKDSPAQLGYRVGQIYGLNTLGCVAGALIGGHWLLELLNMDQSFLTTIGIVLVLCILGAILKYRDRKDLGVRGAFPVLLLVALGFFPNFNKDLYFQPFRQQNPTPASYQGAQKWGKWLTEGSRHLFYKDDPLSSIGIVEHSSSNEKPPALILFSNGKSDGSTDGDILTMSLTGHLPALFARQKKNFAVIGFGTGVSAGIMNQYPGVESIDVLEISPTLLKQKAFFDPFNGNLSKDPKVHFHAIDAFRFFNSKGKRYDAIASEPSNPWVAGVENLYSREFYQKVKRSITPEGVLVQWLQGYSFNSDLFKRVLATLQSEFKWVSVFQMLEQDFALIATNQPVDFFGLTQMEKVFEEPSVRKFYQAIGISDFSTLLAYEIVPAALTPKLISGIRPFELNSSTLSYEATKAMFLGQKAQVHQMRRESLDFLNAVDESLLQTYLGARSLSTGKLQTIRNSFCHHPVSRNKILCREAVIATQWQDLSTPLYEMYPEQLSAKDLHLLKVLKYRFNGTKFTSSDLEIVQSGIEFYRNHYSSFIQLPAVSLIQSLDACLRLTPESEPLRGDCYITKIQFLSWLGGERTVLVPTITKFQKWFESLPESSKSKEHFKKAYQAFQTVSIGRG